MPTFKPKSFNSNLRSYFKATYSAVDDVSVEKDLKDCLQCDSKIKSDSDSLSAHSPPSTDTNNYVNPRISKYTNLEQCEILDVFKNSWNGRSLNDSAQ